MKRSIVSLLLLISVGAMAQWMANGPHEFATRISAKPKPVAASSAGLLIPKGPYPVSTTGTIGEIDYSVESVGRFWPGYFPNSKEPDAFGGVEIGDVTGDGRKDLIITAGVSVHIIPQTSQGGFGQAMTYELFAAPRAYSYDFMIGSTLADMNRDGVLDIVITRAFSLVFILSDGRGGFRMQVHANSDLMASTSTVIFDIDGDGFQDAITPVALGYSQETADTDSRLVVAYGDGMGGIARFGRIGMGDRYIRRIETGDLNNDGRPDLATIESDGQLTGVPTLVIRYHDGVGGFRAPVTLGQAFYEALATGDFNGDGRTDLAVAGVPFEPGGFRNQTVSIFHQDAGGMISATPVNRADLNYTNVMLVHDLDGDGLDDLVTGQDAWASIGYFLQRNGRMTDYKYYPVFLGADGGRYGPDALAAGDLNGDGVEDLAVAAGYLGVMIVQGHRVPYTGAAMVPGAPTIGVATLPPDSTFSASVSFSPPASNGGEPITGYTVQAIPDGPRDSQGGQGGTTHLIYGLENDKAYRFVVRAHSAAGESAPSAMSNAVTHRNLPQLGISDNIGVLEGDSGTTTARFEISTEVALSGGIEFDVIMDPTAPGTTAIAGEDYVLRPPTHIVISPGGRSATFDVQIIGDTIREGLFKEFYIKLANVTGAKPLIYNSARCRIMDNDKDPMAMSQLPNFSVIEGNAGLTPVLVTFRLPAPLPNDVTFDASTFDGSALAGVDYVARQQTGLRIPAGQTSVDFVVNVIGDQLSEGDEYFLVATANEVGTSAGTSGYVTITSDDDGFPTVSIDDEMVVEGDGSTTTMVFTATLSGPAPYNGSYVEFVVDDADVIGTPAIANRDYAVKPVTGVIIRPGETTATLVVKVLGDTIPEADELFRVRLLNIARAVPGRTEAHGLIIDNDRQMATRKLIGEIPTRELSAELLPTLP